MKFKDYEKIYAERHRIPCHWLHQSPNLALAALLEWQVATHFYSLPEARRRYVKEYPESNRQPVSRWIVDKDNKYVVDEEYAFGSVLNLIIPYEDSIREIRNLYE